VLRFAVRGRAAILLPHLQSLNESTVIYCWQFQPQKAFDEIVEGCVPGAAMVSAGNAKPFRDRSCRPGQPDDRVVLNNMGVEAC
jgi:hypothetical protein